MSKNKSTKYLHWEGKRIVARCCTSLQLAKRGNWTAIAAMWHNSRGFYNRIIVLLSPGERLSLRIALCEGIQKYIQPRSTRDCLFNSFPIMLLLFVIRSLVRYDDLVRSKLNEIVPQDLLICNRMPINNFTNSHMSFT